MIRTKEVDSNNKPLFISFSGGETSGFMLWYLLQQYRDKREIIVLFANTGQENEETLEFVDKCDKKFNANIKWIESRPSLEEGVGVKYEVVDFNSADRNGKYFEQLIQKNGLPSTESPFCTERLKSIPMQKYLKDNGYKDSYTAIGIRADEIDRCGKYWYPLVSLNITKQHVNKFWSEMDFKLQLKGYQGNCKWCFKKSIRKHLTLINENPEYYDFPKRMEEKYANYVPESRIEYREKQGKEPIKLPLQIFRKNLTVKELEEMAKGFTDYAQDDTKDINYQTSLINGFELDVSNGCVESCEIY